MKFPIGGKKRKLRVLKPDGRSGQIPEPTVKVRRKERIFFIAMNNVKSSTKKLAKMGVLAAISVVLVYIIHFPIVPAASFLEYDPADVPILLGTFALGPLAGLLLTVVAAVIQGVTVSSASGWYGIVMHIIATGCYVIAAGNIYKHKKTKKNAIIALAVGVLVWVIVMIPANIFLTPIYLQTIVGLPAEAAKATVPPLLPWIILFNLIKSVVNSVLTFLLYKRVSGILHR